MRHVRPVARPGEAGWGKAAIGRDGVSGAETSMPIAAYGVGGHVPYWVMKGEMTNGG
jgi:hypothetical protein